jgi:hypothetical protein
MPTRHFPKPMAVRLTVGINSTRLRQSKPFILKPTESSLEGRTEADIFAGRLAADRQAHFGEALSASVAGF